MHFPGEVDRDFDTHYIRNGKNGSGELYNITTDPDEVRDLAVEAAGARTLPIYEQLMERQPKPPEQN